MRGPFAPALFAIALAAHALAQAASPAPPYPDPARLWAEIAAFQREDSLAPPAPGAILCVGSSSLRMWHGRIARDLAPLTLVPRGFGGSTYRDVLAHADRLILPYRPRALLLYEGDNDIDFGVPAAAVAAEFRALVADLRAAQPDLRLYVLAIKPSPARWQHWPAMREANALIAAACAADSLLAFVDVAGPMLGEDGLPRAELYLPDRLHLSEAGYDLWTAILRPRLLAGELQWEAGAPAAEDR
jgi:lysophospholipase L1-like esterase